MADEPSLRLASDRCNVQTETSVEKVCLDISLTQSENIYDYAEEMNPTEVLDEFVVDIRETVQNNTVYGQSKVLSNTGPVSYLERTKIKQPQTQVYFNRRPQLKMMTKLGGDDESILRQPTLQNDESLDS